MRRLSSIRNGVRAIARGVPAGVVALLFAAPAHAYLDPGTANLILQSIIGILAAIGAGIGVFWSRIQAFFSRGSHDKPEDKDQPT